MQTLPDYVYTFLALTFIPNIYSACWETVWEKSDKKQVLESNRFGCDGTCHTYPVLTGFVSLLKSQYSKNQLAELL